MIASQGLVDDSISMINYADQYTAVDALKRLVGDDSIDGRLQRVNREDVSYHRYLLDCVYGLKTDDHWPQMPRYYDWQAEFERLSIRMV